MSGTLLNYPRPGLPGPEPIPAFGQRRRAIAPRLLFESPADWVRFPNQPVRDPAKSQAMNPVPAGFSFTPAAGGGGGDDGDWDWLSTLLGGAVVANGLLGGGGGSGGLLNTAGSLLGVTPAGLAKQAGQALGLWPAAGATASGAPVWGMFAPGVIDAIVGAPATAAGANGITMSVIPGSGAPTTMLPAAGAAAPAAATGAGMGLGLAAGELGSAGLLGGIGPADAALLAELYPALQGTTGTVASTAGGTAALSAAPATAAAGEAAAAGAGPALFPGSALAGAAAFALPLAIAGIGMMTQPDLSAHGGRVDIGVDPATGQAVIRDASGKRWDMDATSEYVQSQLDALNSWMGQQGLRLNPGFQHSWEFGNDQTLGMTNTIWDRVGFLGGEAFMGDHPALAPDRFYTGWTDFAQQFGGGPQGVPVSPRGYQMTPQDATDVFHEGLIPLFGGPAADYSDRWLDLAQRQADYGGQILGGFIEGEDISTKQGLPAGLLDAFAGGADPRALPTALTPEQYTQMVGGEISGPDLMAQLYGAPAPSPAPTTMAPDQYAQMVSGAPAQPAAMTPEEYMALLGMLDMGGGN